MMRYPQHPSHRRRLCAVVPAMILPFVGALFYFVIFSGSFTAQFLYAFTKLFTVLWPLLATYFIFGERLGPFNWSDSRHLTSCRSGAFLGLILFLGLVGMMETAIGNSVRANADTISAKIREIGIEDRYWSFGLFLAVIHSLIEEYYWRWFVYGNLRTLYPPIWAHLLAGVSFAAHHLIVLSQFFPTPLAVFFTLGVAIGGIIWSLLYERQGTLVGAWISHIAVDLAILIVGYDLLLR